MLLRVRDFGWSCVFVFLAMVGTAMAENTNQNRFGFTGKEIFPIDNQLTQLRVGDLDGDGLNDLIVVNNARSKITLLYNQTGNEVVFVKYL